MTSKKITIFKMIISLTLILSFTISYMCNNKVSYSLKIMNKTNIVMNNTKDAEIKINELYMNIPNHLKNKLYDNSLIIYLCDDIKGMFDNENIIGLTEITNLGNKRIYLSNENIDETFYHEIGHAINYEYGHIANSNEFVNIYELEKNNIPKNTFSFYDSIYAAKSSHEYFAEAFSLYMHNADACKTYIPSTYEFLKQNIFGGNEYGQNNYNTSILWNALFQQTTRRGPIIIWK